MSSIKRLALLWIGALSLLLAAASSAGAVTWHTTGDSAFTAGGGPSTFSVTGTNLVCPSSSAVGTAPLGAKTGSTVDLATGAFTHSGCTLNGIPTHVQCSFTFLGTSTTNAGGTIDGTVSVLCGVVQFGAEVCKIEGTTAATYHNPFNLATTGRLTLPSSTTLRTTNGTGGSCSLAVGEPSFMTAQSFSIVSNTGGPRIARTA